MGNDGTNRVTQILSNSEGGHTALSDSITGLEHGAATWTDFDNDGLLDFAVAGNKDTLLFPAFPFLTSVAAGRAGWLTLFRNNGNNTFSEVGTATSRGNDVFDTHLNPIFSFADIEAADYDNDGDDDLVVCGVPAISWSRPIQGSISLHCIVDAQRQ